MENYYKNKDVKKYCQKADNPNYPLHHFETPFRSLVTRHYGKSPLAASAVLHCVYLAWKHPRRQIEMTFQVSGPAFPPQTRPCVR